MDNDEDRTIYDDGDIDPPTLLDHAVRFDATAVAAAMAANDVAGILPFFLKRIERWASAVARQRRLALTDDLRRELVTAAAGETVERLGGLFERCESPQHLSNSLEQLCRAACHRWLCEAFGSVSLPYRGRFRPDDLQKRVPFDHNAEYRQAARRPPPYWRAVETLVASARRSAAELLPAVDAFLDDNAKTVAFRRAAAAYGSKCPATGERRLLRLQPYLDDLLVDRVFSRNL